MTATIKSGGRMWLGMVWKLTAALAACILIIGVLVAIAFGHGAGAKAQTASAEAQVAAGTANRIASCVNSILSTRNEPTANDSRAHLDFALAMKNVLLAPKAQQAAEYTKFLKTLHDYVATLQLDQAQRDASPLGRC